MISNALIRKWIRMLKRDSVFHVDQTEGLCYSVSALEGYYNNLTDKVRRTNALDEQGIPMNTAAYGEERRQVYFPISIFQYGLGAYDLWILQKEEAFLGKAMVMADWAVTHQRAEGAWDTFGVLQYHCPLSSMAQGEGASLLARAYAATGEERYRTACQKAVDFMLRPVEDGGTAIWKQEGLMLLEYPEKPAVLNGWIFSAFGILDCWKITGDETYHRAWLKAVDGIAKGLAAFDARHWSYYDEGRKYASPFYHRLHVELLKACNRLEPRQEFDRYISKWSQCRDSWVWAKAAFVVKAGQKLLERQEKEWVFVE